MKQWFFRTRCILAILAMAYATEGGSAVAICLDPPGDLSGDSITNVTDVQCSILMNLWSLDGQTAKLPSCLPLIFSPLVRADHNCDGDVNIADTLMGISFALGQPIDATMDGDGNGCHDACQTDMDNDGDPDFTDCAPQNPAVSAKATEVCNGYDDNCDAKPDPPKNQGVHASCDNGNACDGKETCAPPPLDLGLVFTELYLKPPPGVLSLDAYQWMELYNASATMVDLRGYVLEANNGQSEVIDPAGALFVMPYEHVVFGWSGEIKKNGGVKVQYVLKTLSFSPTSGTLLLKDPNGSGVAGLIWGILSPMEPGASMALKLPGLPPSKPSSWATSVATWGTMAHGTPGGPNIDVVAAPCLSGAPLSCPAGDECTPGQCDPASGCIVKDNGEVCGNLCDGTGNCTDGACTGQTPLECFDKNPCTTDSCDPNTGCVFVPNNLPCNTDKPCWQWGMCTKGLCKPAGLTTNVCLDDNICTDDTCSLITGNCEHIPNNAQCDDNNVCTGGSKTGGDMCQSGMCWPGPPVVCADGNPCTKDSCDPESGCQFEPITGKICDDGDFCTNDTECVGGVCMGGWPVVCNDDNVCTTNQCMSDSGCVFVVPPGLCDDSDPCTTDTCSPQDGCSNEVIGDCCGDGACTGPETCDSCSQDCGDCPQSCCVPHLGTGCDDGECADCVCAQDGFCCAVGWDDDCAETAGHVPCADVCSECDKQSCCQGKTTPGCREPVCEQCVCAIMPECCNGQWGVTCAQLSAGPCGESCPKCVKGECCTTHEVPGCDDSACQECVCGLGEGLFQSCCFSEWSPFCAAATQYEDCADVCQSCNSDCCAQHTDPGCETPTCESCVCAEHPECCGPTGAWTETCWATAASTCVSDCQVCGGFCDTGAECTCCDGHHVSGCNQPECAQCVCAQKPSCCAEGYWFESCADLAKSDACANSCAECGGCGNGVCNPASGESCDSCPQDCGECPCCEAHQTPGCENAACESCVCTQNPACCSGTWTAACAALALGSCLSQCPNCDNVCGNGTCGHTETCANCPTDCGGICNCCAKHDTKTCDDATCQACVCDVLPSCCTTTWSSTCAAIAQGKWGYCKESCACADAPLGGLGCKSKNGTTYSQNFLCKNCVCTADSYCCTTAWDEVCVNKCANGCDTMCSYQNCCIEDENVRGCVDAVCEQSVCASYPECCTVAWDLTCEVAAHNKCPSLCSWGFP